MTNKQAIEVLELLLRRVDFSYDNGGYDEEGYNEAREAVDIAIRALGRTISGTWVIRKEKGMTLAKFICPICGVSNPVMDDHCPNCGVALRIPHYE